MTPRTRKKTPPVAICTTDVLDLIRTPDPITPCLAIAGLRRQGRIHFATTCFRERPVRPHFRPRPGIDGGGNKRNRERASPRFCMKASEVYTSAPGCKL